MDNWLENLEVGDKVFTSSTWHGLSLGIVERITKTQIQVGKSKYRKNGGYLVGGYSYSFNSLVEYTEDNLQRYNQQVINDRCRRLISDLESISRKKRLECTEEMKESLENALKIAKGDSV